MTSLKSFGYIPFAFQDLALLSAWLAAHVLICTLRGSPALTSRHPLKSFGYVLFLLLFSTATQASQLVNLHRYPVNYLHTIINKQPNHLGMNIGMNHKQKALEYIDVKEISRVQDFKHTLHVRLQETYLNYPVRGGTIIMHIPSADSTRSLSMLTKLSGSLDGNLYKNLQADLSQVSSDVFQAAQAKKALQYGIEHYRKRQGYVREIRQRESKLIVYIDHQQKAHWAFQVGFYVPSNRLTRLLPAKPNYILDAVSLKIYAEWNEIKTRQVEEHGGGFGGNVKVGKVVYDGLGNDLAMLTVYRDKSTKMCYLRNKEVSVKHFITGKLINFSCQGKDPVHNNVYWDGAIDAVNGGYAPSNDALFLGSTIKAMYQTWYQLSVLERNGKPMLLNMMTHLPESNAYWDEVEQVMVFGDGDEERYPLTTLEVAAHEMSHALTSQHSQLAYYGQSGGMNESFSDMAAMAADFYLSGKNTWQIGKDLFKQEEGMALRYLDHPSQDCQEGRKPGDYCSIDNANQYHFGLDVHYSSGVYNRAFYLLATTPNWNTKKAFDVMVQANLAYWREDSLFIDGACGVISAAKDYDYDVKAVQSAFSEVGIDTSQC